MSCLKDLPTSELQCILYQLSSAMRDHSAWLLNWHKKLHEGLPMDEDQMAPDAHKTCHFGEWFHNQSHPLLQRQPSFVAIGKIHRRMHISARMLLEQSIAHPPLTTVEYDLFLTQRSHFREEVRTLEKQLRKILFLRDPLDNLSDPQQVLSHLSWERERVISTKEPCFVCLAGLDEPPKQVPPAFSLALRSMGRHLVKKLRPSDLIYRLNHHQLLICLTGTSQESADSIIETLCQSLSRLTIPHGKGLNFDFHGGFSMVDMESHPTPAESIHTVQQGYLNNQNNGRHRFSLWNL